jgi:aminopeptidase
LTTPDATRGPDPAAFARLLCDWCLEVQPGEQVIVATSTLAIEPARALHAELLQRDAWPLLRISPPQLASDFHRHAHERHLDSFPAVELAEVQLADAVVRIDAPSNTRALAGIDPALIARAARARSAIQEARLAGRWCATLWPTPALAQQASMSEDEYAAFVRGALFLDAPDPVAAWRELSRRQAGLAARLADAREIRIEAEGTDLTLRVGGRTWINSDGRRNMPSGEVFTGPLEDSANGTIRFTVPTSPRGVEVAGVELTFEAGRVVAAHADRGDEYLQAALATDAGARYLGELGIGTNRGIDRPTGTILFDEKMAGTVHLALGRSYPETGATNSSALHWDLICDLRGGGRLSADGEAIEPQPVVDDPLPTVQ